jgi:hypothetical protein
LSIFYGHQKVALKKHFLGHSTHIVFIEGFAIVVTTVTKDCGLGGRDFPVGCVEVKLKYCLTIGVGVNYPRGKSSESLIREIEHKNVHIASTPFFVL